MRRLLALVVPVVLFACGAPPEPQLSRELVGTNRDPILEEVQKETAFLHGNRTWKQRLDAFRVVLPEEAREAFDKGDYDRAIRVIEREEKSNREFRKALLKVKYLEAIPLFSARQTVEYFRDYMQRFARDENQT
jgi:hypothetical protein